MIRIALVDDEPLSLDSLEQTFSRVFEKHYPDIEFAIDKFQNGYALISQYSSIRPDILSLDYLMPKLNGIDTAKEIRKIDDNVKIILFTNYKDLWQEGYRVEAIRYIIKSDDKKKIEMDIRMVIDKVIKSFVDKGIQLTFRTFHGKTRIPLDKIEYVELIERKCYLFMINSNSTKIRVLGGMKDIYEKLKDFRFIRPLVSCCVNLKYVKEYKSTKEVSYLLMESGKQVFIARDRKKETLTIVSRYMEGGIL